MPRPRRGAAHSRDDYSGRIHAAQMITTGALCIIAARISQPRVTFQESRIGGYRASPAKRISSNDISKGAIGTGSLIPHFCCVVKRIRPEHGAPSIGAEELKNFFSGPSVASAGSIEMNASRIFFGSSVRATCSEQGMSCSRIGKLLRRCCPSKL